MQYLFVYGTLMRKFANNPFRKVLEKSTVFVGEAFTYGKLFLVDYYPGLVPNTPTENHKTFGEIVLINEYSDLLIQLDEYEDYFPDYLSKSLYIRKVTDCFLLSSNEPIAANLYFYNQSTVNAKFITDGNFMTF